MPRTCFRALSLVQQNGSPYLYLGWSARDGRTPVTLVTVCLLLRGSGIAIYLFFLDHAGNPTWTRGLGCHDPFYVQIQDFEIGGETQGPVRRLRFF